jgi:hypothetical protein
MLPGTGDEEIVGCGPIGAMCRRMAVLAAMFAVAPIGAGAGYLMVEREKGQPGGGRSSREIIAAFERETGKPGS